MNILQRIRRNKERRKRVVHILSGFIILVHACEKWDSGHESWIYFAFAGTVFLLIAVLHPVIERKMPWVDGVFFVIEGLLSLLVAADYFHMGKKGLPWCYLAVGVFQFVVAFVKSKKGIEHHRTHHPVLPENTTAR